MTKYGLRARVFTLTLAPTLIIGLLLSAFFTMSRYQDLEHQLVSTGASIIEPLAISTEFGMTKDNREAVRRLIATPIENTLKLYAVLRYSMPTTNCLLPQTFIVISKP